MRPTGMARARLIARIGLLYVGVGAEKAWKAFDRRVTAWQLRRRETAPARREARRQRAESFAAGAGAGYVATRTVQHHNDRHAPVGINAMANGDIEAARWRQYMGNTSDPWAGTRIGDLDHLPQEAQDEIHAAKMRQFLGITNDPWAGTRIR